MFEAVFGVIFGVISGLKKGKWCDTVILIFSLLLISVPTFVTGFLCQYFLGVKCICCRSPPERIQDSLIC